MEKLKVIKIGGNIVDDPQALSSFLKDFSSINDHKILIHGGGKIATQLAEKLGIKTQMHEGKRITNQETIDIVTMVYGGLINKKIVGQLNAHNTTTIGLTGADAQVVLAQKRPLIDIDYGYVGDIIKVNSEFIKTLIISGLTIVFAPLTADTNGQILNTNADTMAQAIAVAMSAIFDTELIYCFEKNGVLNDLNNDNSIIPKIDFELYHNLKQQGVVNAGMIPKLDNAFKAIEAGVKTVLIGHARNIAKMEQSDYICTKITL